jgi:hypothetical protein
MERAQAELDAHRTDRALQWMRAAVATEGLPTATREQVQTLLEVVAAKRIDELSKPGSDPEDLAELVDLELPRQLAVAAGIQAAKRMQERGDLTDAYDVLKHVDAKYPLHHERAEAARSCRNSGSRSRRTTPTSCSSTTARTMRRRCSST